MQTQFLARRAVPARCSASAVPRSGAWRRSPALVVRAEQQPAQKTTEGEPVAVDATVPPAPAAAAPPAPAPSNNAPLALGAVAAAVVLFAVTRLGGSAPTLATLEQMSTPLDVALVNGRPSVVEFYANWCEVCRELVPDEYELEKQYGQKVNFVMLNIENPKWAPEAAEFGVRGIPHFVFFDGTGTPQAMAVGRVPRTVLEANVQALAAGQELPYGGARGPTSPSVSPEAAMMGPRPTTMPRDHS